MSHRASGLRRGSVALAVSFALAVAACGDSDESDSAAEPAAGGEVTAPTTADGDGGEGETGASSGGCDAGDPVLVGVSLPLSGPGAELGEQFLNGVEYAVEVANDGGGALGRCLQTVVKDDQGDPTRAAQVVRELVDQEEVDFMFGSIYSSPLQAQLPISTAAGVVQVGAAVLTPAGDATQFPYFFRVSNSADTATEQFAAFITEQGWDSAAILAANNAFGTTSTDGFEVFAEEAGIEITALEYIESGQVDVSSQVRGLQETNPDVMVLFTTGADLAPPLLARAELGWEAPVLAYYTVAEEAIISAVGVDNMNQVYAGQIPTQQIREEGAELPADPTTAEFLTNYKSFYDIAELEQLMTAIGSAYDGVLMVVEAANAVGEIDSDAIKEHLESNDYEGAAAIYEYSPERHDGIQLENLSFGVAASLRDGTLVGAGS